MKSLKTASLSDTLHIISIEASLSRALPAIDIVGLAGASIKESSTRVKSALNLLSN
ncbi:MAG: magnesium chelatase domain-containing protein, partial [Campylobacter sp.]|nr:magnesium chelatase domain-containing protein [Campylobacter sp.]